MREKAINLIVALVEAYKSKSEVLVHAVALIDRFIEKSAFNFSKKHRIVKFAVGCFMISVKLRDNAHPCVKDLALLTSCACDDIRSGEEEVLLTLNWNVELTTGSVTSCALFFLNLALYEAHLSCSRGHCRHNSQRLRLRRPAPATHQPVRCLSCAVRLLLPRAHGPPLTRRRRHRLRHLQRTRLACAPGIPAGEWPQ